MSGPFGEEAPGTWRDIESALTHYREILADQQKFGARGRYHRTLRQLNHSWRRWTGRAPAGWYDIHAGRRS